MFISPPIWWVLTGASAAAGAGYGFKTHVEEYSAANGAANNWSGWQENAFQNGYVSATILYYYGSGIAEAMGNLKELGPGSNSSPGNWDMFKDLTGYTSGARSSPL